MPDELKEIRWFNPFDKKMHACRINVGAEDLDFNEVLGTLDDVAKSNEDKCKQIYYLGIAITGSPAGARGFLDGWLVRSMRDSFEAKHGKWTIQHDAEKLSNEEIKGHFIKMLREAADKLESEDEFDPKNAPVVKNRDDGTDLFED